MEAIDEQERKELEGITARLQSAIGAIPSGHFRRLREDLAAQLGAQVRE